MSTITATPSTSTGRNFADRIRSRLRNKILLGVFALFILAAIVGIVAIVSQIQETAIIKQVIETDTRITQLDSNILQSLNTIQVKEQSLLQIAETQGVAIARSEFAAEWQSDLQKIRDDLAEIDRLQERRLVNLASNEDGMVTNEIATSLTSYEQNFQGYLELLELRGVGDIGFVGDFQATSATLAELITASNAGDLQILFLEIENLERDYELTLDLIVAAEVEEKMFSMHDVIAAADISDEQKTAIDTTLITYHEAFNQIVATNADLNELLIIYTGALNQAEKLVEETAALSLLGAEVAENQIVELANQRTIIIALLATASIIAGIVFARVISDRLTNQTDALLRFFNALDREEIDTRAEIVSNDELAEVALTLNQVLDERGALIQTSSQRQIIAASISNLIEDMEKTAQGDLRKETVVSADMTGAIADSFNFMVEQLREIIRQVQTTSLEVNRAASKVELTSSELALRSDIQATQILDTTAEIDAMSIAIQQVSTNASIGAEIGVKASNMAERGAQTVESMQKGLEDVRDQIDETATRLTQLSTDAAELTSIARLIDNITQRTSVLALNASIQASSAGNSGQRFLMVAAQVDALANESVIATREITRLLRTIQSEAATAVSEVQETALEVQSGLLLAADTDGRLQEIKQVSVQLSELITAISQASQQQVRGTQGIAHSMTEIASASQHSANSTRSASNSIRELADTAEFLRSSTGRFIIDG